MLVIPKRHVADYFELGQPELNSVHFLLEEFKRRLQARDEAVKGFNVGINCGEASGQTVFHCHIHLIPRRLGDVDDPCKLFELGDGLTDDGVFSPTSNFLQSPI